MADKWGVEKACVVCGKHIVYNRTVCGYSCKIEHLRRTEVRRHELLEQLRMLDESSAKVDREEPPRA